MPVSVEATPTRDSRSTRSRIAFCLAALALAAVSAGTSIPTPILALFRQRLAIDSLGTILLYALYGVGIVAGLLTSALVSRVVGSRMRLLAALAISALAAAAFLVTDSYGALLGARILSGFASGVVTVAATLVMVDNGAASKRGRSAAAAVVANFCGLAAGALIGGWLSDASTLELKPPFVVSVTACLFIGIAILSLRDFDREPGRSAPNASIVARIFGVLERSERRTFVLVTMPAAVAFPANAIVPAGAAYLIANDLGTANPLSVGGTVAVSFLATSSGQFLLRKCGRSRLLVAHLVLAAGLVGLAVAFQWPTWTALFIGTILTGVSTGACTADGVARLTDMGSSYTAGLVNRYFIILFSSLVVVIVALGAIELRLGVRTGTALIAGVLLIACTISAAPAAGKFVKKH